MTKVLRFTDLIAEGKVSGKRVFIRADLNVPQDDQGNITEDTRVRASVPAIQQALAAGAAVMVTSHLGRPTEGQFKPEDSLAPVAKRLGELLGRDVPLIADWVDGVQVQPGQVVLLENCRCNKGEKKNDDALSQKLAKLCDIYVNDAFGTAHRSHASTCGIAKFLPSYMGPLMQRELEVLDSILQTPRRPFVAVLGGAKVADKIAVVERLMSICDAIVFGGGMANTLLAAQGFDVGKSLRDADLEPAKKIVREIEHEATKVDVHLPSDAIVAKTLAPGVDTREVDIDEVLADDMILDIGAGTAMDYRGVILDAKTVLWNGPMGVFENDLFAAGTEAVGQAIVDSGAMSVVGGGDSAAAAHKLGFADKMTHISTGGGATLEYLEGKELPGVAALRDAKVV
jgi:phosphoglycerate kinase